jgi:citrate lyase subunit beta / citryl-CoA lyase
MTQPSHSSVQHLPTRSYLFVPGNRPERYSKALAAGADAVIIDLEDAVPPHEKSKARQLIADWLTTEQEVLVRVNGPETEWFQDDIQLCHRPGIAGIVLPKAQYIEELAAVTNISPAKPILPIIESAIGFTNAGALSRHAGVQRLVFGTIDFQIDLGIDGDNEELLYFRSQLVLTSRLANLQSPVDGVTTDIKDLNVIRQDARHSQKLGFGAKLCIHPVQVAAVNESFSPTVEKVAWAERVLEASQRSGGNPIAIDGAMVDLPVVLQAQAIVRANRRGSKA